MILSNRLIIVTVLLQQLCLYTTAFTPSHPANKFLFNKKKMTGSESVSVVSMSDDNDAGDATMKDSSSSGDDENGEPRVEPGSHDELMYTLGVNLARQLGDIRPLVENGEELSQVAKGLLDTVVGRLDDDGQRLLLAKRGKELDAIIVERA